MLKTSKPVVDTKSIWDVFEDVVDSPTKKSSIAEEEFEDIDDVCENCKSNQLVLLEGSMCCRDCGMINSKHIVETAEWRYYGAQDTKSSNPIRCGMIVNEFLPKSSLGSVIKSSHIGSKNWYKLNKMRRYHQWNAMPYKERSLYNDFQKLQRKAKAAGIPAAIIQEAKKYYKFITETKISRGANRSALIASSVYEACKKNNVPRSSKEIAEIYGIKRSDMTKGCKSFLEIMSMGKNTTNYYKMKATSALDFIGRYCSNMDMSNNLTRMCFDITKRAIESAIADDNTPTSIAAGCIYLVIIVTEQSINKSDVSKACNVSEVTISKCYKKLYKYRHYLFTKPQIKKYKIK